MVLRSEVSVNDVRVLRFQKHGDARGQLVVAEGNSDIPFDIMRVFYMYGASGNTIRGKHANLKSQFCLITMHGKCKVRVIDSHGAEKVFCLDSPDYGLYIPAGIWKDMYDFENDSVLLVLSSEKYDSTEYIRDYDFFLSQKDACDTEK